MGPQIKFLGLNPDFDFVSNTKHELWRLSDFCPYDAIIEAVIEKQKSLYAVTISICFSGGEFASHTKDLSLSMALRVSLDKMYDQIRSWRQKRFGEDSEFWSTPEEYVSNNLSLPWNRQVGVKSSVKVLIIDDEPESTAPLATCLHKMGCRITVASSSARAIDEITKNSYDLVFLDWNLPEMNGGETLMRAETINSTDPVLDYQWSALKLPVVTYSGSKRKEIHLPDSRHFRFVAHWEKSMPMTHLLAQTSRLVSEMRLT